MRICGIVCSPRINGNTEILVQEVLSSAQKQGAEIELIRVAGRKISPCDACYACLKSSKCHIEDDMQEIYSAMLNADGIVIGTPVYYWSVSAQAKIIIDRTFAFLSKRPLKNKVAGLVVAARRSGASNAFTTLSGFANIHEMVLAGGVIAFGRDKGEVSNDAEGIKKAVSLGKEMQSILTKLS